MKKALLYLPYHREALFLKRDNRFLVTVISGGEVLKVHLHDPGRLGELLVPGRKVFLKREPSKGRKTEFDLIAVSAYCSLVFVHSGYHSKIAEAILKNPSISPFGSIRSIKREVKMGSSRIDFMVQPDEGPPVAVEVKGCTLKRDDSALFPDAPTERGRRHLRELMDFVCLGGRAAVFFLVFVPRVSFFSPNFERDPEFSKALFEAVRRGVEVFPVSISYDGSYLFFEGGISFLARGNAD